MLKFLKTNIYQGFYLATLFVICIGALAVYLTDHNIVQLQSLIEELQTKQNRSSRLASLTNQISQVLIRFDNVSRIDPAKRSSDEQKLLSQLSENIFNKLDSIEAIIGESESVKLMRQYIYDKVKKIKPQNAEEQVAELMELNVELQKLQFKHSKGDFTDLTDWTVSGRAINFLILVPVLLFVSIILESKRRDQYFQTQRRKAEEENEAKTQFLSFITHELKTPMTTIMALSKLLKRSELEDKQLKDVEFIEDASRKQLTMINEILQYSKLLSTHQEIERHPFKLRDSFDDVIELFNPIVERKKLELKIDLAPEIDIRVVGDPTRFLSLTSNIVGNACKFTEKGGVYVKVNAGVMREDGQQEVLIEVKDTGIGIPEEKIADLFEPFSQVDVSTTRLYGGTGLGLTIAKKIVEMLGGSIEVESEDGMGTVFKFNVFFELPEQKSRLLEIRS